MDRIVNIFWTISILKMLFSLPIQLGAARSQSLADRSLAKSQRKDDWLGCVVMGLAFILNDARSGARQTAPARAPPAGATRLFCPP